MNESKEPLWFDPPIRRRIYDSIVETIGNTPLVRIKRICAEEGITADVLLKLEFFNPIASVKDRIGVAMIEGLEAEGKLAPGGTIVEPTSGNTGIGLAFVCRRQGLQADPHHARIGLDRAAQDAGLPRCRGRAHPAREGHEGRHRRGRGAARRSIRVR